MSDWRTWPTWRQVEAASIDRVSGAATVGAGAARGLAALVRGLTDWAPDAYPSALVAGVTLLLDRQPVMAPVLNVANEAYLALPEGPEVVAKRLEELAGRLDAATVRVGQQAAKLIRSGSTVLTHSASTAVRAAFERVGRRTRFRVCCTQAMPEGEGLLMAAELHDMGLAVELIADEDVDHVLPGIDLVLVGADAVGPDQAINKAGTEAIASESQRLGVPFYIVASQEKTLPQPLFERAARAWAAGATFDVVPLSKVEGVVTEEGPQTPTRIARLAEGRPVAPQLA